MNRVDLAELRQHVKRNFPGRPVKEFVWDTGPASRRPPGLRICRIAPEAPTDPWVYVTLGASATIPSSEQPLEFFILSPIESPAHVETLTMLASFHSEGAYHLSEGKVVDMGRPWMDNARADHLLLAKPFPFGPRLEFCQVHEQMVRFLWLVPITRSEADYARGHGSEALEALLESNAVETLDPHRTSVV